MTILEHPVLFHDQIKQYEHIHIIYTLILYAYELWTSPIHMTLSHIRLKSRCETGLMTS